MASNIVKSSDLKMTNLTYTVPSVRESSGGKSVGVLNSKSRKPLQISTPLMLSWGITDYEGDQKFTLALQFPNNENATHATDKFLKNMIDLENKIKDDAIKNCKEWFGKGKMSAEVIDALWTPMLKYPKDKMTKEFDMSRAPSVRIKVPCYDGVFKSEFYDVNSNLIFSSGGMNPNPDLHPSDIVARGSHVGLIITCGGLWFAGSKFGVTWKLDQCMVQPKESISGKCHIFLDDDEKDKMKSQVVSEINAKEEETETLVNDTDDEGEEETQEDTQEETEEAGAEEPDADAVAEEEVVPEPVAPTPKKTVKRVVKKKAPSAEA